VSYRTPSTCRSSAREDRRDGGPGGGSERLISYGRRGSAHRERCEMTLAAEPTRGAAQGTFNDLREFIAEIEAEGELRRLEGVSADLEMGAITEIYAAEEGPAVLFDRIPGHAAGFRLVSNLFATLTRTAKVLRLDPAL